MLQELFLKRRSIRQYSETKITRDQINSIVEAGLLAPSGRNLKPWQFIIVQNKETLLKLSHSRLGAAKMLEKSSCAIVVFGDSKATDTWIEDCSLAMSYMQLMATELGLGSCWIQGRMRDGEDGRTTDEICREILSVPNNYQLEAILSLGVINQASQSHTKDELDMNKIHYERYESQI